MGKSDYLEMSFRSINCFSDGVLDVNELGALVNIALRDGVIDEDEKRVLRNIIGRLNSSELTYEMNSKIRQLKSQHGV